MDDNPIWRYMDLAKFICLLKDRALYFPNSASFEDPFEGSVPLINAEERRARLVEEFQKDSPFQESLEEWYDRQPADRPELAKVHEKTMNSNIQYYRELKERIEKECNQDADKAREMWLLRLDTQYPITRWDRQFTYISCWYESRHESAAMWKLYLNGDHGACIRSTLSSLEQILADGVALKQKNGTDVRIHKDDTRVCRVTYIDFDKGIIEGLQGHPSIEKTLLLHTHKRESFSHEQEVRAMFYFSEPLIDQETTIITMEGPLIPHGHSISIDLNQFIEEVYVAPHSPDWVHKIVGDLVKRYGLDKKVTKSSLSKDPVY